MTTATSSLSHSSLVFTAALLLVAACDPPAAADAEAPLAGLHLQAPEDGDLIAPPPIADAPPVAAEVDRAPVSLSWPIDQATIDLDPRPRPHVAESRAYWQVVSAAELAAGVPLAISEPGALLKLSARGGGSIAGVVVESPEGAEVDADDALEPLASPMLLADAGAPFPPGTALYTLRPELGAGLFTLRADAEGDVLIYVLERESPVFLSLEPSSMVGFVGDTVTLTSALRDPIAALDGAIVDGELVAPGGARSPLPIARAAAEAHQSALTLPRPEGPPGALYTVQIDASGTTRGGLPVRRTVTHALAINLPTARFTGALRPERLADGGVRLRLGVDVGAASRYGASAVLYADHSGSMRPLALGQAARWLDAGASELVLDFAAGDLVGEWTTLAVHDLRLVDQGRVQVLHRQAEAATLTGLAAH